MIPHRFGFGYGSPHAHTESDHSANAVIHLFIRVARKGGDEGKNKASSLLPFIDFITYRRPRVSSQLKHIL